MDELTLYVDNTSTSVSGKLRGELYKGFKQVLGYQPEDSIWRMQNNKHWDGFVSCVCFSRDYCKCDIKKDGMHFPTGLISKAIAYFLEKGIPYKLVDVRDPIIAKAARSVDLHLADVIKTRSGTVPLKLHDYQIDAVDKAIAQQRGIIRMATGGGKCLGRGTPVLMFDGTIKLVENVLEGDLLMGPDSKPRRVLSTCRGRETLYRISPTKGEPYVVNESHILSLKVYHREMKHGRRRTTTRVHNISVSEYLKQTKTFKHCAKGYRASISFAPQPIALDPYYLGIWLGDGTSANCSVTTADTEVKDFLRDYAESEGVGYWEAEQPDNASSVCHLSTGKTNGTHFRNRILNALRDSRVLNNKHIPHAYRCNSREVRLQVLAGLLDSDGCASKGTGYDYTSKSETLAKDVAFIARSLGLAAYVKPSRKQCTNNGKWGDYHRVTISGDCSIIPVRIARKSCSVRRQKKDVLVTGIAVKNIGVGDYYGFEIDGDHLFMLGDFTVTHNTVTASAIIAALGVAPTIFYVTSMDLLKQAADEIETFVRQSGKEIEVGRVGGGHKKIRDITVMTVQTAVRALGHKYIKTDEEDTDDSTNIDDIKEQVRDLIQSAKLCICDEVHHWAAETCQVIADNSLSCRWRYGMSATPWRDKGDDILIDACFGKKIVDINASFLIDNGFLVKPYIAFVHCSNMKGEKLGSWPTTYKTAVVENGYRNQIIAGLAANLTDMGRQVLVLVQQIQHGTLLEEMMPGSVFLHGSCTKKQREEHIEKMKLGKATGVTIASTIFDEGIDCKPLNALILAGGGKSPTRALQRIGRVIRTNTYPDGTEKKDAYVYDIYDHQKYLTTHATARRKIYMSEPSFDLRDVEL
jgi:superfamily II DNA or RNA helicase